MSVGARLNRRRFLATTGGMAAGALLLPGALPAQRLPGTGHARPRPTPSQLAWQREELALFVHFTVNTFTGREWGTGRESPRIFDPQRLDVRQWASTARRCGFGSMILTAKHHDGFCLWPTRTTGHSVRNSPWRDGKGDLVREFVDACSEQGLGAGLYVSPWDRNAPSYGQGRAYDDVYIAQLTELLTDYGALVEIWFDGANGEGPNGKRQGYDWPRIHRTVRALQPDAVIFSDTGPDVRWIGNERGEAGMTCWSNVDPARVQHPGAVDAWVQPALMHGDPHGSVWRPGEADVSIRPGWFWHPDQDDQVRDADNLMTLYFESVGRNSKLLLNVPPTRDGLFHERDVQALEQFAARREALLGRNLLAGARVRADSSADGHDASHVLDGRDDRHWQPAAGARTGWIELELPAAIEFDVLRLEEAIAHGQHIANHRIDIRDDDTWLPLAWGTTIGHTRLHRFTPRRAARLRVMVEFAYDTPRLSMLGAYRSPSRSHGGDLRPDPTH